jgi:hypothetical protein
MSVQTLNQTMIDKIRALVEDWADQKDVEVFPYSNSNIFTLQEPNVLSLTQVLVNGQSLQSGQGAIFNSQNNKVTITGVTFTVGDIVEVDYLFTKYSDTIINQYIKAALVWLSICDWSTDTYRMRNDGVIVPDLSDPANKTADLICIIASILIKPDVIHYRMPNLAVNYPNEECQEEKIRRIIGTFKQGIGVTQIVMWNRSPGL